MLMTFYFFLFNRIRLLLPGETQTSIISYASATWSAAPQPPSLHWLAGAAPQCGRKRPRHHGGGAAQRPAHYESLARQFRQLVLGTPKCRRRRGPQGPAGSAGRSVAAWAQPAFLALPLIFFVFLSASADRAARCATQAAALTQPPLTIL